MRLVIGLNEDRSALVIADQLGQSVELKCRSVKSAWFAGAKAIVGEQSHRVDVYGSFDVLDATGEIHRLMVDNYRHSGEPEPHPNESLIATICRKLVGGIGVFEGTLTPVRVLNAVTIARLFGRELDELATILRAFGSSLILTGDKRYYVEPEAIEALAIADRLGVKTEPRKECQ